MRHHLLIILLLHHTQSDIIQALSSFWTALLLLLFEPLPHPFILQRNQPQFQATNSMSYASNSYIVNFFPQEISTQMGFRTCLPFIHCWFFTVNLLTLVIGPFSICVAFLPGQNSILKHEVFNQVPCILPTSSWVDVCPVTSPKEGLFVSLCVSMGPGVMGLTRDSVFAFLSGHGLRLVGLAVYRDIAMSFLREDT